MVGLLKWLGMFTREAVRNGVEKCPPVGHNTSSFSAGKMGVREGKLAYLAGLPHRGSPLVLSYIIPQPRCHLDLTTNTKWPTSLIGGERPRL